VRITLLHGFAGDPAAWDAVIAAWPEADELRAIPLPGHGAPIAASWAENLAAIAPDARAADLVVGYSLGARVALGLFAARSIDRAILIGVNPGLPETERPARRAADARWAALLRERGMAAFAADWEAQPLFATQHQTDPARLAARRARRLALDPEPLARSLETMGLAEMPDYRGVALAGVTLVAGADDAKYVAIARSLAAPLVTIPGSGHDPTLEQPERLAAVLAAITRTARAANRGS
jgi:2-succinyl-6-hydroxy-2,4-cyclohexadiene-1-carboxylate synthase